jgi:hypothetical protein
MNKYTKPTLQKLEIVFKELSYVLRYEKGNFNSGYCIVENTKVVVVNKFFDTEGRVNVLLDILEIIIVDETLLTEKTKTFYKSIMKNRYTNEKVDTIADDE